MSGGGPEEIVIPALLAAVVEDRVPALVPALGPAADFICTSVSVPENFLSVKSFRMLCTSNFK